METVNKRTGEVVDQVAEHLRGLSGYNERGEEIPDPRPVALPVGFTRPKSLQETMQHLLRNEEFRRALDKHELDTFEEAEDFGEEQDERDPFTGSPYEDRDIAGAISREQEIKSGVVEDIPLEKKRKAASLIAEHRRKVEAKKAPKRPKKEEEAQNGEKEEETEEHSDS